MKNLQDEVTEIELMTTPKTAVYYGIGFVNADDRAQYFVSLDPDPGNTYVFKIFKIRNDGFLIHLNNGGDVELSNIKNNMYQIDFDTKRQTPTPKEYKVVLYHENRVIDKKEARQKFDETPLMDPNKTGTGTILI